MSNGANTRNGDGSPESRLLADCADAWRRQRNLCDSLEKIADSLPDKVDRRACLNVAGVLPEAIARAHAVEEDAFFGPLGLAGRSSFDVAPTLARLKLEHVEDACFAEEVAEVLMSYAQGQPAMDSETTGYMLRSFFKAVRRHIAIEEELSHMLGDGAGFH